MLLLSIHFALLHPTHLLHSSLFWNSGSIRKENWRVLLTGLPPSERSSAWGQGDVHVLVAAHDSHLAIFFLQHVTCRRRWWWYLHKSYFPRTGHNGSQCHSGLWDMIGGYLNRTTVGGNAPHWYPQWLQEDAQSHGHRLQMIFSSLTGKKGSRRPAWVRVLRQNTEVSLQPGNMPWIE